MSKVKYLMWPHEDFYANDLQIAADDLFGLLDKGLAPNVFLVGILVEQKAGYYPVCVEPEHRACDPKVLSGVPQHALRLAEEDENAKVSFTDRWSNEQHKRRLFLTSIAKAIKTALDEQGNESKVSICSMPRRVDRYLVSAVLQLRRKTYESHYCLKNGYFVFSGGLRTPMPTSLIDSSTTEYLLAAERVLAGAERDPFMAPEDMNPLGREVEHILKSAGQRLMSTPTFASGQIPDQMGLYDICDRISLQRYESAEGAGKIIVSEKDHSDVETVLRIRPEIPLRQIRAARKLLELTSRENSLLYDCQSGLIYGVGHIQEGYDEKLENLFEVEFIKHHTWGLLHAGHGMMVVSNGVPGLPSDLLDNDKLLRDLPRIFPGISQTDTGCLHELAIEATKQTKGTMLVISGQAQGEADRLTSQCIKTEPFVLTKELVPLVTSIDGSVLLDPHGQCYAIGVILDGNASEKCRPDRGARFNSAVRYVQGEKECLAIVISEDRSVDLIPDLKPQISRKETQSNLEALVRIANHDPLTDDDTREFYESMGWLNEHEFYLSAEACSKINALRKNIASKWPYDVIISYRDLRPDDEMDESYFLD